MPSIMLFTIASARFFSAMSISILLFSYSSSFEAMLLNESASLPSSLPEFISTLSEYRFSAMASTFRVNSLTGFTISDGTLRMAISTIISDKPDITSIYSSALSEIFTVSSRLLSMPLWLRLRSS